jgi:aerobic-type carbon monoxide dehydrogenase small subunit (CoxS/CutS family)
MPRTLELLVNGSRHAVDAEPARTLLSVLRDELDLTGTKYGCGEGQCGACTVMIDGIATRSCQTGVAAAAGKRISTIEALEQHGRLHPLQEAFLETGAMQCGYCTSGMIIAGAALLAKNSNPGDAEIIDAMNGNVCRCGTYPRILAAMKLAAQKMKRSVA